MAEKNLQISSVIVKLSITDFIKAILKFRKTAESLLSALLNEEKK